METTASARGPRGGAGADLSSGKGTAGNSDGKVDEHFCAMSCLRGWAERRAHGVPRNYEGQDLEWPAEAFQERQIHLDDGQYKRWALPPMFYDFEVKSSVAFSSRD